MDFGKKGDAKKAMKLKWKEGISLKEAWKRVQKKSKSKSKTMSPKKRRAAAKAKKVMRMKWDEGISLKEAWKRASFGMGPCPQGFEPNTQYKASKGQRVCIKECDFYQMRNPETNRCKNMTMSRPKKVLEIPDGYELGPTGRLRKTCLPGYYRDPVTGRCRRIKTVLQPLIAPSLMDFGTRTGSTSVTSDPRTGSTDVINSWAWTAHQPMRGLGQGRFGKKCGFGSCTSCGIN